MSHTGTCHENVKNKLIGSQNSENVSIVKGDRNRETFVRFAQLLSDKTAMMLKVQH